MKTCTKCGELKPLSEFFARKGAKDGKRADCKKCNVKKNKDWLSANRERSNKTKKEWAASNEDKVKTAKKKSNKKLKTKIKKAAWFQGNKDRIRNDRLANTTKYRAKLSSFELDEFDKFVLKEAHTLAKLRENQLGLKWHVDHVIAVSKGGSSRYDNIQVVPAIWNHEKSNHHSNRFFNK